MWVDAGGEEGTAPGRWGAPSVIFADRIGHSDSAQRFAMEVRPTNLVRLESRRAGSAADLPASTRSRSMVRDAKSLHDRYHACVRACIHRDRARPVVDHNSSFGGRIHCGWHAGPRAAKRFARGTCDRPQTTARDRLRGSVPFRTAMEILSRGRGNGRDRRLYSPDEVGPAAPMDCQLSGHSSLRIGAGRNE